MLYCVLVSSCIYRFPDLGVSEEVAAGTDSETSVTIPRKRSNPSHSVQVSKKRKKSPNRYSRSRHKNQVNGVEPVLTTTVSEDSTEEGSRANHRPGPESCVRPQQTNINGMLNPRSKVKEPGQKNKMKYKPGPKSQVKGRNDDLDSDNSDVEFVLYKPPHSVLDVIDLTDAVESPEEVEDVSDVEESLQPHIVLTKIPGACSIYTCPLCSGTFTSARSADRHACAGSTKSPTQVAVRGKTTGEVASQNRVQGEVAYVIEAQRNATSEGAAARQKASEKKTHECEKRHNAENTTSCNSSSILQRILSETDAESGNKNDGSENDTSSGGSGSHVCDICGLRCTRLVSLIAHKDRHLYPMSECEDDSIDSVSFNARKKKKRSPKT
jgi:hypothetical protein